MEKSMSGIICFVLLFLFYNNSTHASDFDKYQTDAQMQCWSDNGAVLFIAKGNNLTMQTSDDIMRWSLGQGLKKNGDKLEFIANALLFEFYVNFENRTASAAGVSYQCY